MTDGRRKGRVAAVVNAASSAGRGYAKAYADAGWDVALLGRGWAGLEAAAADVRRAGRDAIVLPIDVTDDAARALAIQRIQDELGPIEAWVAEGLVPRHDARPRAPRRVPSPPRRTPAVPAPAPAVLAVAGLVAAGLAISRLTRRD
jgi:NAD(P)-dependent dehydrogenase (short-subunit alcohol dehydrogenase family)